MSFNVLFFSFMLRAVLISLACDLMNSYGDLSSMPARHFRVHRARCLTSRVGVEKVLWNARCDGASPFQSLQDLLKGLVKESVLVQPGGVRARGLPSVQSDPQDWASAAPMQCGK